MGGIPLNNNNCYLFFAGYYLVSAASQILCRYNINNRIVRAPVALRNSCSFALLINEIDEEESCYLLENEKINIEEKIYTKKRI